MTAKKKKRPASGFREPSRSNGGPAQAPERRGLLDSLFAPRVMGASPMPRIRTSFARGFVLALSTPPLLFGVPAYLLILWSALIALGFQGPFTLLAGAMALPPLGTLQDVSVSGALFGGGGGGLAALLGFIVIRALVVSIVATAAVERLRTGTVTSWALRRLPSVVLVAFMANFLSLSLILVGSQVAGLLGPGLGLLAYFGVLVGGIHFLGFAPAIAADEDRSVLDSLRRSFRSARMPGSGNLTLAVLYTIPTYALLVAPLPGSEIGVNPAPTAWIVAILANLLHVAMVATLAFRYLSVAGEVPETPAPAARTRR
jgi:hypothetical protein